ncbi:MAG: antA/AntB antirepressor family protein [Candidatus Phlomobacter fragariae]
MHFWKYFTTWIKDKIKQYGFVENIDFIVFTNSGETPPAGVQQRNTTSPSIWRKGFRWSSVTKKVRRLVNISFCAKNTLKLLHTLSHKHFLKRYSLPLK